MLPFGRFVPATAWHWPAPVAGLLLAILVALAWAGPSAAQSTNQDTATQTAPTATAPAASSPEQGADALIRLLQDPGARDALIDYLRRQPAQAVDQPASSAGPAPAAPAAAGGKTGDAAVAEAEAATVAAVETAERQPTHIAVRIAVATQDFLREGLTYVERITRAFTSLPTALSYSAGANWERIQGIVLRLLVIASVVFAIVVGLRRIADGVFARLTGAGESTRIVRRVILLLLRAVIEAAVVAIAIAAGYAVAVYASGSPGKVELVESLFLNAFFLVQVAKVATRFALSPKFSALRLVPLDDAQAIYWRRWLFAIYNLLGYGTMVVVPLVSSNISFLLADSVRMMIVLASVALAIAAIMRNRQATRERILSYAESQTNMFTSGLVEVAARVWHAAAILYVLLLLSVWLSRPFDAITFMVRATALSVLTVMAGTIVSLVLTRAIIGGVRLPQAMHERMPLLERRLNTFVPRVLSFVRIGVFIGVVIGILHAWGAVDVLTWFGSDDGRDWVGRSASAGIVVLVGFLIWLGVMSWIDLRMNPRGRLPTSREKTLFGLFRNAFSILLVVMITLLALSEIGVNIGPLIAGAGVFGLAISFGSQKLVQDIITGAFIQFENAMNEGDVVTLGGVTGTVEKLTIRSVRLRDIDGTAHMIPFSTVDRVANFMRGWAYHVAAIGVAYDSDLGDVKMAMHVAFDRLKAGDLAGEILEPLEMHGVTNFGDSAITVRARIKTRPGSQWSVGRAYNEHIKAVFDERGIEIPFPQVTYHAPPSSVPPAAVALTAAAVADEDAQAEGDAQAVGAAGEGRTVDLAVEDEPAAAKPAKRPSRPRKRKPDVPSEDEL